MYSVNSVSGGKTSSYIAVNYPADKNIFSLVRTSDKNCLFPDKKIRQYVEDKIQKPFVGTLEMNDIIYTMIDLEQMIGNEIDWVSGKTFDEIIVRGDKKYLPNKMQRFCTIEMKLQPIFYWWAETFKRQPVEMRIGFRANEQRRASNMIARCDENGLESFKGTFGKNKHGKNKWETIPYRKPIFPLINDGIFKDQIEKFWLNKKVRFAYANNCVGCFHRNPIFLKHISEKSPKQFQWFIDQESDKTQFKTEISYQQIKNSLRQTNLFDSDFNDCDSGFCGL